jgi:nicotinamidase/pyrazinamidase
MSVGIVLVDPQYDFFPGGALAVTGGDAIIAPINALLRAHPRAPVVVTRDWHPPSTRHFKERGGLWVPHCVQDTHGAAFHADLELDRAVVFSKGTDPENDAGYSAFEGEREEGGRRRTLEEHLRNEGVDAVIVAGLATDYCVKASVLGALERGFTTFLFAPGVRPVDLRPGDGERAIGEMRAAGALVVS